MKNALNEINALKNNPVIMDFVKKEAYEKAALDIRARTGSGTTAKAVELLNITNKEVQTRVKSYIAAGLVGVLMAKYAA
jgi:stage III sporulation protein SpoIIIAA